MRRHTRKIIREFYRTLQRLKRFPFKIGEHRIKRGTEIRHISNVRQLTGHLESSIPQRSIPFDLSMEANMSDLLSCRMCVQIIAAQQSCSSSLLCYVFGTHLVLGTPVCSRSSDGFHQRDDVCRSHSLVLASRLLCSFRRKPHVTNCSLTHFIVHERHRSRTIEQRDV